MKKKVIIIGLLSIATYITAYSQKNSVFYKCPPEAVGITIVLDKEEYLPYEPILVEVQLKNISDIPQQFGSLDFFSLNLRYQLFTDDLFMNRFFLWQNSGSAGWFLTRKTATNPSDIKKEQTLLNHYLDFKDHKGEFVIEIGFPIQGELSKGVYGVVGYKTEEKQFNIKEVSATDTAVVNLFRPNFLKLMDGMTFTKEEIQGDSLISAFNRIIDLYPRSYLVESVCFYKCFYYLQKHTITGDVEDIKSAKLLLLEFIGKYPNTVFKGLVTEYLNACNATLAIGPIPR